MKIRVTHEITDQQRLTINTAAGRQGLATREECVAWIGAVVSQSTDVLDEAAAEAFNVLKKALNL